MIPSPPLWPRLLDDLTESYVAWREASGAVRRAYLWWREASPADWWWAFTAYRAALDREEPAARV